MKNDEIDYYYIGKGLRWENPPGDINASCITICDDCNCIYEHDEENQVDNGQNFKKVRPPDHKEEDLDVNHMKSETIINLVLDINPDILSHYDTINQTQI